MKPTHVYLSLLLFQIASLPCYGQAATTAPAQSQSEKQIKVNWIYGAYVPKDVPLTPLTRNQRWQLYVRQTYTTPGIYVKTALFAGGDQISDSPAEWDGEWGGFARRLASRQGQFVIQNSLAALANGLLRYEPRYDRCHCDHFWPRMGHATVRNFITYDQSETKKRPQIGLYGAAFAAGAISSTWKPNQQAWTESYRSALTQAGFGIVTNVISEFAPEIFGIFRKPKTTPPTTNPPSANPPTR